MHWAGHNGIASITTPANQIAGLEAGIRNQVVSGGENSRASSLTTKQ